MWTEQSTCQNCGSNLHESIIRCPKCNHIISVSPIEGPKKNEVILQSMWSLKDFLPIYPNPITLHEGNTPLVQVKNLDELKDLSLKLEFRNPTGSFRDRASSLIITDAVMKESAQVIGASTGSFSISLSAYAAKAGIQSQNVIYKLYLLVQSPHSQTPFFQIHHKTPFS